MKRKQLLTILLVVLLVAVLAVTCFACKDKPDTPSDNTPSGDSGNTSDPGTDPGTDPSGGEGGGNVNPGGTQVNTGIDVPKDLAVANGRASWKRVSGATFELEINGTVITIGNAINYNLLDFASLPADGSFTLRVRAIKDGKASEWSSAVTYTYVATQVVNPTVTGLDGTRMQWTASSNALYPLVTVGGTEYKLAADATGYDLAGVTQKSDVTLTYVADGVYYKSSATVRLTYDPATTTLAYAAPAQAYMDGEVLRFDRVEGANAYYFQDVQGRVTSLTGEDINSLSNDRNAHLLIKYMWAGNTDLDIANSAPTEIIYFGEGKGTGTSSDPFLVESVSDLRYIEYYEAVSEAQHTIFYYKLAADVVFEAYQPKDDEEFSNFYNLGSFSGVLDGDGHSLKNIVVYYKDGYSSIFDNVTETGVIKNLVIEDTAWRTWTVRTNDGVMHEKGGEVAVLAYTNRGRIEGVTFASGKVTAAKDGAAGLVSINRGTISGCTVASGVAITGVNEVGAIAIYNAGTIEDCHNAGTVKGTVSVGGIVGRNAGLVTRCGNVGKVSGDSAVGGIVGYNYNVQDIDGDMQYDTLVSYCYNKAVTTDYLNVFGMSYVGGIVGKNGSTGVNELGLVSYANAGVYGCYNQSDVSGTISAGGIAGENCSYYNGAQDEGFGIRGCYTSGVINVVDEFEAGRIYLSVSNCVWAENDDEHIFVHYWKAGDVGVTTWPGVQMTKTTVGGYDFYYADLAGVSADQVEGLIFCRVNPYDHSGGEESVHNKTENLAASVVGGKLIYAINDSWTTATKACVGWLAGYNNMVYDSYYSDPTGEFSEDVTAVVGGGTSNVNKMTNTSDKQAIAAALNAVLDGDPFVVSGDGYPVLDWELEN